MRKAGGGAIVNISSGAGFTPVRACGVRVQQVACGIDKTALELGRDNIRVNSLPRCDSHADPRNDAPDAAAMAATMAGAGVGLSRFPHRRAEEITRLVLFVASTDAASRPVPSSFADAVFCSAGAERQSASVTTITLKRGHSHDDNRMN